MISQTLKLGLCELFWLILVGVVKNEGKNQLSANIPLFPELYMVLLVMIG
jgi:hypothetical protein